MQPLSLIHIFVLDETMAKNDSNVMSLLNDLWSYALPKAKVEATELQQLMDKEGKGEKLEAWDWWYYTEKLRKEKYLSLIHILIQRDVIFVLGKDWCHFDR